MGPNPGDGRNDPPLALQLELYRLQLYVYVYRCLLRIGDCFASETAAVGPAREAARAQMGVGKQAGVAGGQYSVAAKAARQSEIDLHL